MMLVISTLVLISSPPQNVCCCAYTLLSKFDLVSVNNVCWNTKLPNNVYTIFKENQSQLELCKTLDHSICPLTLGLFF